MNNLIEEDPTFNPSTFISKVNNIFVMLCVSMTTNNLSRVSHFLSKELLEKKQEELDKLNSKNIIQMYDELNVSNTFIQDIQILDDRYQIKVLLSSKYLDYRIDKDTKKIVDGNNKSRIEKNYILFFEKKKDSKKLKEIRTCPTCGSVMDINNNGVCKYCRNVFSQEDYDWILKDIY